MFDTFHEQFVLDEFIFLGTHGSFTSQFHLDFLALLVLQLCQLVLVAHLFLPLLELARVAHVHFQIAHTSALYFLFLLQQDLFPQDGRCIQLDLSGLQVFWHRSRNFFIELQLRTQLLLDPLLHLLNVVRSFLRSKLKRLLLALLVLLQYGLFLILQTTLLLVLQLLQ
jgi:hypothetical protein